jgi:hypothetical protein
LADKRQKRKRRQAQRAATAAQQPDMERLYARGRAKDEEARAKLQPLPPGERPGAVTVAAIVALGLALAELVAFTVSFDPDEASKATRTAVVVPLLLLMAWGMWKAKYWAVLGMQALLALTVILATLALTGAGDVGAVLLIVVIVGTAGTLFYFLVRAMARIQMPERPGAAR